MLDHETAMASTNHFAKAYQITVIEIPACQPSSPDTTVPHVPRRTTSLKTIPKQPPTDNISLHNRYHKQFSSIDGLLHQASAPTRSSKSSSISAATTKHDPQAPPAATNPSPNFISESQSRSRHATPETSITWPVRSHLNTIISWTSEKTRVEEYSKIDKAHTGCRGLIRALLPRRWCRKGRRDFFDGYCDGDSVRRFRVSVPDQRRCRRI